MTPPTMRERILGLATGLRTEDEHLIASVLGLDAADVAATLSSPSHVPSSGGGGSSGYLPDWANRTAVAVDGGLSPFPSNSESSWTGRAVAADKWNLVYVAVEADPGISGGDSIAVRVGPVSIISTLPVVALVTPGTIGVPPVLVPPNTFYTVEVDTTGASATGSVTSILEIPSL